MPDLRCVFDTNIVVSALLLRNSVPRQAFDLALEHGTFLLSDPTIREINDVLRRDRFDRYVSAESRLQFLAAYVRAGALVSVTRRVAVCRDPSDDALLDLAVCGVATCVVSGDMDLLSLGSFDGIPIIAPKEFVERYA